MDNRRLNLGCGIGGWYFSGPLVSLEMVREKMKMTITAKRQTANADDWENNPCKDCGQPNGRHLSSCPTRNKESARKCFIALTESDLKPPYICPEKNCHRCIIHRALEALEYREDYWKHPQVK